MMNIFISIIITISVFMLNVLVFGRYSQLTVYALAVVTAVWAGIEVKRLNFSKYRLSFPSHPFLAIVFVFFVWFVGFPMFLNAWISIMRKTAKVRELSA